MPDRLEPAVDRSAGRAEGNPLLPWTQGCWVRARVVGVFWIRYDKQGESHREAKIITAAEGDPNFGDGQDLDQLPEHLLRELENFFDVYKMLEPGTSPAADGYEGREAASVRSRPPGTGPVSPTMAECHASAIRPAPAAGPS